MGASRSTSDPPDLPFTAASAAAEQIADPSWRPTESSIEPIEPRLQYAAGLVGQVAVCCYGSY